LLYFTLEKEKTMNKFKNVPTAFSSKVFIAAAVLSSLFALSGHFAPASGQTSSAWNFKEVRVFPKGLNTDEAKVVKERYDEMSGSVELSIDGKADGLCPGGNEIVRLNWTFDHASMKQAISGQGVSASLEAYPITINPPCGGAVAASSSINMRGSDGLLSPFSAEESSIIDGGRFYGGGKVSADPKQRKTDNVIAVRVRDNPPNPKYPNAWFSIYLGTPAGEIHYVYIYELSRGTSGNGGGSRNSDLAGNWESYNSDGNWRPTSIRQEGNKLWFTNESANTSSGYYESATRVKATDWGNLGATISENRINWDNGSIWRRRGGGTSGGGESSNRNISGSWIITQGSHVGNLSLDQSGTNLSGAMDWNNHEDARIESGWYADGKVEFVLAYSNGLKGTYRATVDASGKSMTGGTASSNRGTSATWYGTKRE
jgi:hypothetical protein